MTSAVKEAERTQVAVREFTRMIPMLTAFVRSVSGRPDAVVQAGPKTATDGRIVYLRPPLALADSAVHERALCDKRGPDHLVACPACARLESLYTGIYHEVSHVAAQSTKEHPRRVIDAALGRGRDLSGNIDPLFLLQSRPGSPAGVITVARDAHPYAEAWVRIAEEVRVDSLAGQARPGVEVMRHHQTEHLLAGVSEGRDPWIERPVEEQLLIAVLAHAQGHEIEGRFSPDTVAAVMAPGVQRALALPIADPMDAVTMGAALLGALNALGLYQSPDQIWRNQQDNTEESSDDDADDDAQPGNQDAGPDSAGGLDRVPDDGEGAEAGAGDDQDAPVGDGSAEPGPGDEEAGDSAGGDESGGAPEASGPDPGGGGGGVEAAPGDPQADGTGAGELDGEPAGDDAGGGAGGGEAGGDAGPGPGSEQGGGGVGGPVPAGPPDGRPAADPVDGGGDALDAPGGGEAGEAAEGGGEAGSAGQAVTGDVGPADGDAGAAGGSGGGDADADADAAGGVVSDEGEALGGEGVAGDGGGDEEPVELEYREIPDFRGMPMDQRTNVPAVSAIAIEITGHEGDYDERTATGAEVRAEEGLAERIRVAINQALAFDSPSTRVTGLTVRRGGMGPGWRAHPDRHVPVAARVLAPSVLHARRVFSDSKIDRNVRNLRKGKISSSALGKRAWGDDDRLFKKKLRAEGIDFEVVIGLDISYSTSDGCIRLIKQAGEALASVLDRVGVTFSLYAHTTDDGWDTGMGQEMLEVKSATQPWGAAQHDLLARLSPAEGSLDGHNLEFYRKTLDRSRARKRMIVYFTDGEIPETNQREEKMILLREIETIKARGYGVMAVGIGNDSPKRFGLDTVRIDRADDIVTVIKELEKRITN